MKTITLTQGKKAVVDDEDFIWLSSWKWFAIRDVDRFYAARNSKKRLVRMHRSLMNPTYSMDVDHINGNGLDNRRENLRVCSRRENARNSRKRCKGSSMFKGVCLDRQYGTWRASVRFNRKLINIGRFRNEEEAARAYDNAAEQYFGVFAHVNFPKKVVMVSHR